MKELIGSAEVTWDAKRISSHSLKPTLLSWCAKFGIPLATRRKLGGHAKARDKSVLAYSRDELSEPLRDLRRVMDAVRQGSFDPDASRSGLWKSAAVPEDGAEDEEPGGVVDAGPAVVDPLELFEGQASQHSDKDEAATEGDDVEGERDQDTNSSSEPDQSSSEEPEDPDAVHFVNVLTGKHHIAHEADEEKLKCGKLRSSRNLRPADFSAAFSLAAERCKGCYPRKM